MTVRARVWSTPGATSSRTSVGVGPFGFTVGFTRRSPRTWHYAVYNSAGDIVLYDNTGHWEPIITTALIEVTALRHMETAGHKLKPYKGDRG